MSSAAVVALRAVHALLRDLEADRFSALWGSSRAWGSGAVAGSCRLRQPHPEHPDHGVDTRFDSGVDNQAVHGGGHAAARRARCVRARHVGDRYLGLEETVSAAVTPGSYHLPTHTSGIVDDADEEAGERYENLFVGRPNYSVIETADYSSVRR